MERRSFGAAGPAVAALGQGTWELERGDRAEAVRALRRGIDLGLTHVDTAEMYGSGRAEEIVGEAISGIRDRVFLVSKVLPSNAGFSATTRACEQSLKRLRTDRLDCYLLHWRGHAPLIETFKAFETLKSGGKILSWGVSNCDVGDLDEAVRIVGDGNIACNQVLYNLEERAIEHSVIPWCEAHGVAVVAYSPFNQGRFRTVDSKVLGEIARARGATPRQVALRFLLRWPSVLTIPKAGRTTHVEENAGADRIELTPEDIRRLEREFPRGEARGLPML